MSYLFKGGPLRPQNSTHYRVFWGLSKDTKISPSDPSGGIKMTNVRMNILKTAERDPRQRVASDSLQRVIIEWRSKFRKRIKDGKCHFLWNMKVWKTKKWERDTRMWNSDKNVKFWHEMHFRHESHPDTKRLSWERERERDRHSGRGMDSLSDS